MINETKTSSRPDDLNFSGAAKARLEAFTVQIPDDRRGTKALATGKYKRHVYMSVVGKEYLVILLEPELKEQWFADFGFCTNGDQLILLNSTISPQHLRSTLIHELHHAWTWETGVRAHTYTEAKTDAIKETITTLTVGFIEWWEQSEFVAALKSLNTEL